MKEQLKKRLEQLKSEFESGQKMLAEKEAEIVNLRNTILRISGAIQVLEEELAKENPTAGNGDEQLIGQDEFVAKVQ
jgi:uncharacterized coiled-coil DUF342 family protein